MPPGQMNQMVNSLIPPGPRVASSVIPKVGIWFYVLTKGNPQPNNYNFEMLMNNVNIYFSGVFD
jgi:hypothetical protein